MIIDPNKPQVSLVEQVMRRVFAECEDDCARCELPLENGKCPGCYCDCGRPKDFFDDNMGLVGPCNACIEEADKQMTPYVSKAWRDA